MRRLLPLLLLALTASAFGQEAARVKGSKTTFPLKIVHTEGVAPVVTKTTLALTGAGMRTKLFLDVYTVGSYVDAKAFVPSAEALIGTEHLKQLRLVFERDLPGKLMASSITSSIQKVDPKGRFKEEIGKLEAYLAAKAVKRGDVVTLTHIPGKGLRCRVAKHPLLAIGGDGFGRAVWKIYFGKTPLTAKLKKQLTARLKAD